MLSRSLLIFFLSVFGLTSIWAQDEFPDYPINGNNSKNIGDSPQPKPQVVAPTFRLSPNDSVYIVVENGQKYLIHTVKPKQTLYSVKRFYSVELSDLYYSNPELLKKMLYPGQKLRIPIVGRALKRYKDQNFTASEFVPVYYRVQPKETLFRVARIYFKMPIEAVKQRNKLVSDVLSKNQVLHMCWLSCNGIPDSLRKYTGLTGVLGEKSAENRRKYEYHKLTKTEMAQEGAACWLKGQKFSDQSSLSVMHSGVKVGSIIQIENPMSGRILYARVVGPVPKTSYADGSIVMLSPTVAHALGALDARFYIKIRYLR